MTAPPERRQRRSIRLRGYDYTQAGSYFITICVRDRLCIFASIVNDEVRLSSVGKVVADCWAAIPAHFGNAELDAFVVMPNHLHGVVVLESDVVAEGTACRAPTERVEGFGAPVTGSIPTIVRSFKSAVTKAINDDPRRGTACRAFLADFLGPIPPGRIPSFWQRNYHEHIIRDERVLNRLRSYVAANPALWDDDSLHPDQAPQIPPLRG